MKRAIRKIPIRLLAIVLTAMLAGTAAHAQNLRAGVDTRPLTPQDIKDYALTGSQGASGLATVPINQPVYLEAQITNNFPASNIVSVSWSVTSKPAGALAPLTPSPLGSNVPVYNPSDRLVRQAAGRTVLTPDVAGAYTVTATITTTTGSTNVTENITAATYMGINTCALCHSGGLLAPNKVEPWSHTAHATKLTREIDGGTDPATSHYSKNCISCHTVGYNANTNAVNGGFDDVATQLGWTFPTNLVAGNWAAMPAALKNLSNIQCENCHGPGSEHAYSLGNTSRISKTFGAGDCGQCHDSKNNHFRNAEWNNSRHAVATRTPSGTSRAACARCHTGGGFAEYTDTLVNDNTWTGTNTANTAYTAITCATCHNPHDASNPHQLRAGHEITLGDGTTVTNAGAGGFCMNCHQSRTGSLTNSLVKYPLGQATYAGGSSSFGPHDNPAADMLEGVNGYTYGKDIPSAAHRTAVADTCVGCHMQPVASSDPAFTKAGGHTMKMSYDVVSDGVTNTAHMVGVCVKCHGEIESFDMVRQDYNGDGVIEGIQTEVQNLLNQLARLFPSSTYRADGNYVADGLIKSPSVKTNWPAKYLQAAWNWQFVNNDLSKGVHNAPYAVGLLKASIGDLTGDANNDTLSDAWQIQYFGSATDPNAAPNATPAGDGIPNWLKYALGLNPTIPGLVVPDGVVWANATALGGGTNTVHIYTAAEVVFDTELGRSYQIQSVSSLSGGWQNVGPAIPGTGQAISYVTPTRSNAQQFYRVVHTP